jgi:hypothetical protein
MSDEQRQRLAVVLALRAGITQAPYNSAAFAQVLATPAGDALASLPAFSSRVDADLGRVWSAGTGGLQLAVQARKSGMAALAAAPNDHEAQPLLILRWGDVSTLVDADRQRLWQQLWQAANLLLPMTNTWLAADENCSLSQLAAAPAYEQALQVSADWLQACELVHRSLAGLLARLSTRNDQAPVIGYEYTDQAGCVVAEAEAAWPAKRVAIVMTPDAQSALAGNGWTLLLADAADLEVALEQALMGAA